MYLASYLILLHTIIFVSAHLILPHYKNTTIKKKKVYIIFVSAHLILLHYKNTTKKKKRSMLINLGFSEELLARPMRALSGN
jgi:hypothetical protein